MSQPVTTEVPVHPLFVQRHSPYAFDPDREVTPTDLRSILEAARWAMSSYNAQPWRYVVGVKQSDPQTWQRIYSVLVEGNQPWAINAPVLALGVVERNFEYNGKPNKAASHDLGAASAFLTMEATARGLAVHQMIGIEPDKARAEFALQDSLEPLTALAIGFEGDPRHVPDSYAERDAQPRERKPIGEIVLAPSPFNG
ncbi:MAG: nitroreductase family protein [Pseudomonadota bacterium]